MVASFRAELEELGGIGAPLRSVVSELDAETHGGLDADALGFPDAVAAWQSFVGHWATGREEITNGVRSLHRGVETAVAQYELTDKTNAGLFAWGGR